MYVQTFSVDGSDLYKPSCEVIYNSRLIDDSTFGCYYPERVPFGCASDVNFHTAQPTFCSGVGVCVQF